VSTNIEELVEKIRPEIEAQLAKETVARVAESLSWSLQSAVREMACKYIEEHVLPEVKKDLETRRLELVASICAAVTVACADLGTKITEVVVKNLSNEWTVREIAKKVFDR